MLQPDSPIVTSPAPVQAAATHRSIAWPLVLVYVALIVFASLFPFDGWRTQGISPAEFLLAKIPPPYWTWFDVLINVAGYAPLGFLLSLGWWRQGWCRTGWLWAFLVGALLSLAMEFLQIFLPHRVSSNMDWLLNALGTLLGALVVPLFAWLGLLRHWGDVRDRWFMPDARGAIVLLMLWPLALLFPPAQPFGLGQVFERLEGWMIDVLENTAFEAWMPHFTQATEPLSPIGQLTAVLLGLLIPCWLAFSVMTNMTRRMVMVGLIVGVGIAVSGLSSALSYGPAFAWDWLDQATRLGIALALALALLQVGMPRRYCVLLLLMGLMIDVNLLNQAPLSPYYATALQSWEQGRFIRFFGLGQWLSWLWPFAAMAYVLLRLARVPVDAVARRRLKA
ncbi:MAG: VanZ family protein [Comamonas sp.]